MEKNATRVMTVLRHRHTVAPLRAGGKGYHIIVCRRTTRADGMPVTGHLGITNNRQVHCLEAKAQDWNTVDGYVPGQSQWRRCGAINSMTHLIHCSSIYSLADLSMAVFNFLISLNGGIQLFNGFTRLSLSRSDIPEGYVHRWGKLRQKNEVKVLSV
jgi:hypothetical protein